ncbi:Protein NRT1/ PTR FAMILY 7.1 [Linum perenne]
MEHNHGGIEAHEERIQQETSHAVTAATSDQNIQDKTSPIIAKGKGGWVAAFLLLANQGLATLAFFGVGVNLVLFLARVMGRSNADAANEVSIWTGTVYLCSLLGAFLSDSYWGRFRTCGIFQGVFVVGLVLISVSTGVYLIKPDNCGDGFLDCKPATNPGSWIFTLSIYLVALGYGGHQPTLATFGADQFDESSPKQQDARAAFFCYFYFALNCGSLISNTVLVYYEDTGKWTIGFIASLGAAVLALVLYLAGMPLYRYIAPCGNPLPRVAQVFVVAIKKRKVPSVSPDELYEVEGTESAIKGSRKIKHSNEFEMLDKAATITESDNPAERHPWKLCTVTQVEEAKCVLKMLPIWLCTIIYSVVFTQMASLFVEQGDVMNTKIGNFRLPAGLTELQRMGIGLVIGMLAMVAAGITEIMRLKNVSKGEKISKLSVFWQIPQYALVGASEVFMYVGQLEFFNGQAPDGIKSFGSSLCMASISLGNYVSSLLVNMVMIITARGQNPGWIPEDLNRGRMDLFYFTIAGLTVVDLVAYVLCARWYKPISLDYSHNKEVEVEMQGDEAADEQQVIQRA